MKIRLRLWQIYGTRYFVLSSSHRHIYGAKVPYLTYGILVVVPRTKVLQQGGMLVEISRSTSYGITCSELLLLVGGKHKRHLRPPCPDQKDAPSFPCGWTIYPHSVKNMLGHLPFLHQGPGLPTSFAKLSKVIVVREGWQ